MEFLREHISYIGKSVDLAICDMLQERKHERLVIRDRHGWK